MLVDNLLPATEYHTLTNITASTFDVPATNISEVHYSLNINPTGNSQTLCQSQAPSSCSFIFMDLKVPKNGIYKFLIAAFKIMISLGEQL